MWLSIKAGKAGKKPHKKQYRRVAHMSFENILKNRCRRQQGICDGVDHQLRVNASDG